MKVLIKADTQSVSCYPLTTNKPNALMHILGKTLLEHCISRVQSYASDLSIFIEPKYRIFFEKLLLPPSCKWVTTVDSTAIDLVLDAANYYPDVPIDQLSESAFPIVYAWDLLSCQEKYEADICASSGENVVIEPNVMLKGDVRIGEGTVLKSGVYIEGNVAIGAHCTIGPNAYIRGVTSIGSGCHIGNAVEVKNTILGNNVSISHLSYLGDSVVGNDVNIGGGLITANLRQDMALITTLLDGEKINTGRQKIGAIIGDNAQTGIHTSIYPGRKIGVGVTTKPGEVVDKDRLE